MSLSTALSIAQSSLLVTSRQTSVVSRNVADASNTDYSRRIASVVSTAPGARSVQIQRAVNEQLFRQNLAATSDSSGQSTLSDGLDQLEMLVNGVDNASSASTAIGKLQQALQLYATSPGDSNVGASVIEAAKQVVSSLNGGSEAIQSFRTQLDGQISTAVGQLNTLLDQFQTVNQQIMSGTAAGTDVSDQLDQRDGLLKQISQFVPISTFTRGNNDMVITTTDGTTLFETVARSVTFAPTTGYDASTTGNAVYIDNVPLKVDASGTNASGSLAGMLQLRDNVTTKMQSQLDEIARGLVSAFAETSPSQPDAAGLFTWSGAPAVPASGTLVSGIAASIGVNTAMDPDAGGTPTLLRDGGANGAAYVQNTGGGAGYADLLISYGDKLDQPMAFDAAAGITATSSVTSYSAGAIGWFEGVRQNVSTAADNTQAMASRTSEALSNATGVNVDTEMSLLLDLEHTYQASARIMNSVSQMLDSLLAAVN